MGRYLLLVALVVVVFGQTPDALADSCSCPGSGSLSRQSGRSMCSATLIEGRCATVAVQPGPQTRLQSLTRNGGELADALKMVGIDDDPDRLLQTAASVAPADLEPPQRLSVVALVLGLSSASPGTLRTLVTALRQSGAAALAAFADPAAPPRVQQLAVGAYTARVSYGCIELSGPDLTTEARVPLSTADGRCDSFR